MRQIVLLLGLFFVGAAFLGCGHLAYQPTAILYVDKSKLAAHLDELEIQGPYGKIIAWRLRGKNLDPKKPKILLFHGNAQNVSSHFYSLYWLMEYPYEYIIFDYPGYGGSEGEPDQQSTTDVGKFMIRWMSEQYPDNKLVIFGQSLGGNIAAYAVAKEKNPNICLVTIESSFLSYRAVGKDILASNWFTWVFSPLAYVLLPESHSAKAEVQNITPTPLIFIHGRNDQVVSFENGQEFFAQAQQPKEFWDWESSGHIDVFTGGSRLSFQKRWLASIDKHCQSSISENHDKN